MQFLSQNVIFTPLTPISCVAFLTNYCENYDKTSRISVFFNRTEECKSHPRRPITFSYFDFSTYSHPFRYISLPSRKNFYSTRKRFLEVTILTYTVYIMVFMTRYHLYLLQFFDKFNVTAGYAQPNTFRQHEHLFDLEKILQPVILCRVVAVHREFCRVFSWPEINYQNGVKSSQRKCVFVCFPKNVWSYRRVKCDKNIKYSTNLVYTCKFKKSKF